VIQTPQGVAIGQSNAINYYVASICGLLGKNATETALVLSFAAHIQARKFIIHTSNVLTEQNCAALYLAPVRISI
jgi:hypothetical protein